MLPFPAKASDPVVLADWLEVTALTDSSQQVSLDALGTAALSSSVFHGDHSNFETTEYELSELEGTNGVFGGRTDFEITEYLLAAVVDELIFRENYSSYPFNLTGSSLECRHGYDVVKSTYMFCLALSVLPWNTPRIRGCFPERIFEEISVCSLRNYINGEAVRFGWPRVHAVLPRKFSDAIAQLSELTGEGGGPTESALNSEKNDAGVDVVSWKQIDDRMGKVMIWGSCATGDHWEEKLQELNPSYFCRQFFNNHPEPLPAKSFFTSNVISRQNWGEYTRRAGILFDRLRIAMLNPTVPMKTPHGNGEEWLMGAIDYMRMNYQ